MTTNIMTLVSGSRPSTAHARPFIDDYDDDSCPTYDAAVSRSNSNATSNGMSVLSGNENAHWSSAYDPIAPLNIPRRPQGPDFKRYVYTYNMLAAQTPMQFYITVEPFDGKPKTGQYQFRLSMRVGGIERPLGDSITRHMSVDPRKLDFAVFVFPGKGSKQVLPVNSLWSLRVWLRVDGVDHQLFRVEDLLAGKDLDFNSIGDASFARQAAAGADYQVYRGYVGRALITFTIRWHKIRDQLYKYSVEYDGGGVGDVLLNDFRMRVDNDPRAVSFLIYSIPVQSMPVGATHKLRVWVRTLVPLTNDPAISQPLPFNDSYIYQRIFKLEEFKVGGRLEFNALGNKLVMGFSPRGGPDTVSMARSPIKNSDKEREKEKLREREKEKMTMSSSSQGGHTYSSHNQGYGTLPPGAQHPTLLSPQSAYSHQQLPNLYRTTHSNPASSVDGRERSRLPPQVQKSKSKIEIV